MMRRGVILSLVELLTVHDQIEKELIHLARLAGKEMMAPSDWEKWGVLWKRHDALEREILYSMADATNAEIHQAVEEYDASDAGKTANRMEIPCQTSLESST